MTKPDQFTRDDAKIYVTVNSRDYQGWLSSTIEQSLETLSSRFTIPVSLIPGKVLYLCQPFRVGANRVGQRLRICSQDGTEIECLLARIAPARFQINVIYL